MSSGLHPRPLAPAEDAGAAPPGAAPRPWRAHLWRAAALVVLLAVFAAYLSPHLALDLANRLWACF